MRHRIRRNADERIRRLERAAASGDVEAQLRLDVESVKLGSFPLHLPTKRIKAVVRAMLSPQEIRRLGHDLRGRYTWQDLVAYLQEDPADEPVIHKFRKGSTVYSWEHDHTGAGLPSRWKKGRIVEIKRLRGRRVAVVQFDDDPAPGGAVPRNLGELSPTPLEGEYVQPPKVRRRGVSASYAALWLDEARVGTPLYGGLAYFWGYPYKHLMREVPDLARKAIHDTWLKHGLVLHGESPEHERLMNAVLRTPEGWHWEGGDLVRGRYGTRSYRVDTRPRSRWRPPHPLPNPRMRRNADRGFREIERRFQSGDPGAWEPYVRALRQRGDWLAARDLVLQRMVASGEWVPWPSWGGVIDSAERAAEVNHLNFSLATHFDDEFVAVPMLGIEEERAGDIETLWFSDGPYVVAVDRGDYEFIDREVGGAHRGERTHIPLWRVHSIMPPPFGIPQEGYEYLREGHSGMPTIDVSYGPVVHVDGPVIRESADGTWEIEEGWLASPLAVRAM